MSRLEAPCNSAENRGPIALHARTWFRVVATLASGKKLTLRRRLNNSYSHVALYAHPGGPDNHPGAYYWRLTNGKVPKTFHMEDTKWWLLELIPIELQKGKWKLCAPMTTASTAYGNVILSKSISAAGILPTRFFGGEKEQKKEPGLHG